MTNLISPEVLTLGKDVTGAGIVLASPFPGFVEDGRAQEGWKVTRFWTRRGGLGSRIGTRDVFLSMRRGVGWIAGDVAITWE